MCSNLDVLGGKGDHGTGPSQSAAPAFAHISAACLNPVYLFQGNTHSASGFFILVSCHAENIDKVWKFHPKVEVDHRTHASYQVEANFLHQVGIYDRPSPPFEDKTKEKVNGYQALSYVLAIFAGVAATIILYNTYWKPRRTLLIQAKTREEHRGIIDFTPIGQRKIQDKKERQATRARPNRRLEVVFGIRNAFTTTDLAVHKSFLDNAKKKMQKAIKLDRGNWQEIDGDWSDLRKLAQSSTDQVLSQSDEKLKIVDLVRVVTLKVSLRFLFDTPDTAINSPGSMNHLILIGQEMNNMWIASKDKTKPLPEWSSESNFQLHLALRAVCTAGDVSDDIVIDPLIPEANPMNWLLPAYETMWRVVLACVIELRFRNAPNANKWRTTLKEYISDTSQKTFKGKCVTPGVYEFCVNDIVKETLRLYPPTRHVYRRFTEDGEDVKADIEFCHRNNAKDAFGPDSLCFRPERWFEIRAHLGSEKTGKDVKHAEEERGFMPFAVYCPAGQKSTQAFGLRMIALLAGVLCNGLDEYTEWDLEGKEAYQDLTLPLPSGRPDFDELMLIRKH